ncbi:Hypothetical protein, putative [Bodo saltans]|uniref:Uncharacterized protein n=1 Tax=Bodo saltans TaxID=75058 RepID=A0A0S4JFZ0_BODSA|nr:Hypothetical protein, putative [Bodo saltans]|eukprot:CUG89060.1 Hypothetical protein, putative [Bodo saltans]
MTRAMQSMLGDALGIFLSLVSRSKPHWYSSAADLLMALAVPLTQQQIASSSQSATASSSGKMSSALAGDNRAYVPRIVTRAVSMWCGVAAGNDTHRQAVIGSMMPFIKADLPKQVSQTALTCLSLVISSVRYLRQDLSGTLFALTKVLCITMTQVATAASDVCARVASLDVNALYSLMRMQTDLIEDVTKTEPITHALMGVSKILTALPHETLHAHAPAVLEVFMTSFCTLGNIAQYSSHSSSHATSSPTSDSVVASKIRPELEDVWRSELLARRLEQTHAFAHTLLHCAASAPAIPPKELKLVTSPSHQSASSPSTSSSVLVLSPAVVHCMWQSCIQHLTALLDAATQMGALPASPKSTAAPTPYSSNHNNALLLPPPPAPWLRGTLAVATTLTLLGERSVVDGGSDGTKAQQRRQSVTIWFSILRVIAQGATTENNSGPSAALLVKLKKEVWRNLSSAVRSLSAEDETASSPLLPPPRTPNSAPSGKLLPQAEVNERSSLPAAAAAAAPSSSLFTIPSLKRSRQMAQRCISAALDEIDAAVRRACPIHCTDAAIFPASTSGFMTSCRRTMPLAHQVPSAISAAAATEFLATCFASPIISSASLRSDIIRSLFDMLLKPIAADGGVIARWNVAFVLHQCLHRDLLREDDAASSSPPPHHRRLWVSDTDLQAVASTLRLQLLGEQFCGIITTAGAAAGTATATTASLQAGGSVIDLQMISARALASLNALVDGVSSLVSQVALEQGQRATSTGGAASSSAAALEGSRSAVGSLILLSECSAVMKRTAVSPSSSGDHHRSTMDDTQQLLPLITSHMNVLLSRMTSGGGTTATSTSASQPTGATSGLFGDPCSPVAIAIGISVARMSESHGMTVLREVFPAQLQSTLLLKPTSLAVDPIVQNLLWAALCNAERCVHLQSKSRTRGSREDNDDDEDWSAQNCGGRPASLLARHSWETAALCKSITDADTLRASLSLLLDHLNCTASSLALAADAAAEGSPLRRRKRGGLGVNPQHLLMSLMTIQENKLVLSQLEDVVTTSSPTSFGSSLFHQLRDDHSGKSVSTLVASCVAHILAMSTSRMQQQQQQRRGGATSNFVDFFVAELKL